MPAKPICNNFIIAFVFLLVCNVAAANLLPDDELANELEKYEGIDSASVSAWHLEKGTGGVLRLASQATFSMTDGEIQKLVDYAAQRFRAKYKRTISVHVTIEGKKGALNHSISFQGRRSGSMIRGEEKCSDARCRFNRTAHSRWSI